MHRGIYAYDPGHSATAAVSGSQAKQQQQLLAAKVVPRWVMAAPRAAAKAYVLRLNTMLQAKKMTAAALLFDVTAVELSVRIPLPLAGFTIAQLQFPRGSVVVVSRRDKDGKPLDAGAQLKLNAEDELVLKGQRELRIRTTCLALCSTSNVLR